MAASIVSIGTCVPRYSVSTGVCADFAATHLMVDTSHRRTVRALYRRTGIASRGSVLLEANAMESLDDNDFYPPASSPSDRGPSTAVRNDRYASEASELAKRAATEAIERAGVHPNALTHLVTVSCTGFNAPGFDIELISDLGLPATTQRVHVGFMGCHGLINGLRVAEGMIAANPNANVLLCSVELCSLHMQYGSQPDQMVSNALFADGSGAMVLRANDEKPEIGELVSTGSCLLSGTADAMTWRIGDHGFEMTLSPQVPSLIQQHLRPFVSQWLAQHDQAIESIGGWAVHPGGPRILQAVDDALALPDDALAVSRAVLAERGNMSSATMAFLVDRFVRYNQPKPWMMIGFGPGLEIEVALIR